MDSERKLNRAKRYWQWFLCTLPASLYVVLSLLIGETHPFSRFEMYDHFPSEAHAFRILDGNGELQPSKEMFAFRTADLSHSYSAASDRFSTLEPDSAMLMARIGESLMDQLLERANLTALPDTLILNLVVIRAGAIGPKYVDITIHRHVNEKER